MGVTLKRTIQRLAGRFGYRIVPASRDAMSLQRVLDRLPIRTVIDVGANDGRTSTLWLRKYPKAHVHAVEALARYQETLARVAAASAERMTVWNYAASDEAGEVVFHEHTDHPSSSSLLTSTETSHRILPFTRRECPQAVKAIPLDTLFAEQQVALEAPIFLKLDVQGAEAKVLRGSTGLLEKTAAVLTEVNLAPVYDGQAAFPELCRILECAGLNFAGVLEQFHTPDGRPVYLDAVFLRPGS